MAWGSGEYHGYSIGENRADINIDLCPTRSREQGATADPWCLPQEPALSAGPKLIMRLLVTSSLPNTTDDFLPCDPARAAAGVCLQATRR